MASKIRNYYKRVRELIYNWEIWGHKIKKKTKKRIEFFRNQQRSKKSMSSNLVKRHFPTHRHSWEISPPISHYKLWKITCSELQYSSIKFRTLIFSWFGQNFAFSLNILQRPST
jgi:hypothetical protein